MERILFVVFYPNLLQELWSSNHSASAPPFIVRLTFWTNTFINLNKYICQFEDEKAHFWIWTNTFFNLNKSIRQFAQNYFQIDQIQFSI